MPRICALSLVLVFTAPAWSQQKPVDYQPKDGRFTIQFQGKPKETTQSARTQAGSLTVHTATFATREGSVYLVSYTDFPAAMTRPENRDALYKGVRDGLLAKDGKLVSETEVKIDGAKGRELVVDRNKQQMRFRIVVKDARLFQLGAVGTGPFVTGEEVTAFFDSFEFK